MTEPIGWNQHLSAMRAVLRSSETAVDGLVESSVKGVGALETLHHFLKIYDLSSNKYCERYTPDIQDTILLSVMNTCSRCSRRNGMK